MILDDDDVDAMLEQVGEPVTIGAVTANAVVRTPDEEILTAGEGTAPLIGRSIELTVKTGAFPVLDPGTPVTRGAESYVVHSPLRHGAGTLTKVLCEVVD